MKKNSIIAISILLATVSILFFGCTGNAESNQEAGNELETDTLISGRGYTGNPFMTVGNEKGYFEEYGLTLEEIPLRAGNDVFSMLNSGQVDIISNQGTSGPLQHIAAGEDLTIFGGHMTEGAVQIIGHEDVEWNGLEDLIGKKIASSPTNYTITGPLLEMGYDPVNEIEWVQGLSAADIMAAVAKGEVDYGSVGTEMVKPVEDQPGIKTMVWFDEIVDNYSCCRMFTRTDFIEENPNTFKALLKGMIRAQADVESNPEETAELMSATLDIPLENVNAWITSEHYKIDVDPLYDLVHTAWDILDETGYLDEEAKNINLDDHINIELYSQALEEVKAEHYDENPEFYDTLTENFEKNTDGEHEFNL